MVGVLIGWRLLIRPCRPHQGLLSEPSSAEKLPLRFLPIYSAHFKAPFLAQRFIRFFILTKIILNSFHAQLSINHGTVVHDIGR